MKDAHPDPGKYVMTREYGSEAAFGFPPGGGRTVSSKSGHYARQRAWRADAWTPDTQDTLDRLAHLADHQSRDQDARHWLTRVQQALGCFFQDSDSHRAQLGPRWRGDAMALHRPELLVPMAAFWGRQNGHQQDLQRLARDIEAGIYEDRGQWSTLQSRLSHWVDQERELQASLVELMFRLYWDDLGGEA